MEYKIDPAKPTILMMSDCPLLNTGQAVVVREVATGLSKLNKYNIVVAGWGYNGFGHNLPFMMLPASAKDFGKSGFSEAGIPGIEQIINHVKPTFLWTIGDIWMVNYIAELSNRKSFKWIAYTPIDGEPIPSYWGPWLRNPDRLVLETQYGYDEVKALDSKIDSRWIYHGCNPRKYYPLPAQVKNNIRKTIKYMKITGANNIGEAQGIPENAFVVGTVARNQPRKNFDRNLRAFKIFAADKPLARLWLHTSPIDQGYNLVQLANHFGIADKVVFSQKNNIVNGSSEEELNMIMNTFDIFFCPTQGEGFGLPFLESMAAGVPGVTTDYTSHTEFCKYGGLLIPVDRADDMLMGMPHHVERAIPRPSQSAMLIQKLYDDKELRLKLASGARAKAETMTWDATIPQWEGVFDEFLKPKSADANKEIKLETIKV